MARDRLAAMRQNQQYNNSGYSYPTQASGEGGYGGRRPNPYAQQDDPRSGGYEMSNVSNKTYGAPPPAADSGMSGFYSEISSIQDSIENFNQQINEISRLHQQSLGVMNERETQEHTARLDELVAETSALSATLKRRIKALEAQPVSGRDAQIRRTQTSVVKQKFIDAIQRYQQVEHGYRKQYQQRMERQIRIVKPDATPEEIRSIVDSGDVQVFQQGLMNARFTESRQAYREVQSRHQDIQRIEKTLAELAQLFNDMSILVEQQHETIAAIEQQADNVMKDTEAAAEHTEKAVVSARAARKKRWICFIIILIIIIAVVGGVVGKIVSDNANKK